MSLSIFTTKMNLSIFTTKRNLPKFTTRMNFPEGFSELLKIFEIPHKSINSVANNDNIPTWKINWIPIYNDDNFRDTVSYIICAFDWCLVEQTQDYSIYKYLSYTEIELDDSDDQREMEMLEKEKRYVQMELLKNPNIDYIKSLLYESMFESFDNI
jgi:hypothetical protein